MTPHFTLAELTATQHRQFDNTPNDEEKANLLRLAELWSGSSSCSTCAPS